MAHISQTAPGTMEGSPDVKLALDILAREIGVPNLCIEMIRDALVPRAQAQLIDPPMRMPQPTAAAEEEKTDNSAMPAVVVNSASAHPRPVKRVAAHKRSSLLRKEVQMPSLSAPLPIHSLCGGACMGSVPVLIPQTLHPKF